MAVPRQMTDHMLNPVKGWFEMAAVDFTAKFSATQLAAVSGGVAFSGRCVHLNSSGEFEFGATGNQMAMWVFQNSDDPDVANEGGDPATVEGAWVAVAPAKWMTALVAKGAYELSTTEYDTAQTYAPNDLLFAPTGTTLATCGVVTNTGYTYPTTSPCGVVSRTAARYANNKLHLFFWPVWLPSHSH